ncbi:Rab GTPase-binding exocyst subunit SEC15 [Sporobolomyces koalae]|uniref:Rab GTPase-binding exocyst subunit SEC15 n=1 Tax=Sporobolomyces koalae TaxID=500713 RepID=UPI003179CAA8
MASRSRRPKFTQAEINQQLQQLFLFSASSTLTSTTSDAPAASLASSAVADPTAQGDLDQLGPILVNIHRSNQQDAYLRALKTFVRDKEREIEDICARNYQDFVGSVSALLRVRQGTVSLKHRVVELNDDVQQSGAKVADKKKELLEARRVGQNIDEAIDTLQACLRVLDLSSKIQRLIHDDKFFSALRQLDDLQQVHLKPVLAYPFASQMLASLPDTRSSIRDAVTKSLKAWMYEAREASRSVGKGALDNMELRGRRWSSRRRKDMGTMRLAKINGPVELGVSERYEYNALDNDQVRIEFKPLYICIHIYTTLDLLQDLQLSYQADRRAQAYLLLSTATSLTPFSLAALSGLLEEIVGFFLIESHVLKTTNNFRSEQDVEDLWDGMCERVVEIVDQGLKTEEDPEVFLGTKFKVLTFVQTLEGSGYSVAALHSLLLTLFSRYSQLLQRKFSGDFEQIVLDDDHQPMIVNDREEFEKVVSVSWLPVEGEWSKEHLANPGFPLALPFSQTYPLCCIDIRSFTEQYYQFSEGFAEHHRDIDDVLRKALDNLLIQQVSENIQRRLATISNLSQLAQIVVNVLFFQTACTDLETLLVTLRATQRGGTIHLDSLTSFNQTLLQTQDRIISQISLKMDSFFEEAEYPWTTLQPPHSSTGEASGYLMDLMDFSSTVMMSVLIQLPEFAKDYVYKGALKYCSMVLSSYLTDKEPRMISDQGLMYLAKDVKWLIEHVKSLQTESLLDVFTELDQTLTLLTTSPNPTSYLDSQTRTNQYSKINSKTLQAVAIKLVTFYNSTNGQRVDTRRRGQVEELLRGITR